jgi:hypothetical protein
MAEFTTLVGGLSLTKCPRWRDGRLYLSDFYTHRVLALAMDGTAETIAYVPQQPAGLGFLSNGRLLIVSMLTARSCGVSSTVHLLPMPICPVSQPCHRAHKII